MRKPEGGDFRLVDLCEEKELSVMTVAKMKHCFIEQLDLGDIGDFRAIFRNESLEESECVIKYKIKHMSSIHLALYAEGGI